LRALLKEPRILNGDCGLGGKVCSVTNSTPATNIEKYLKDKAKQLAGEFATNVRAAIDQPS